MVMFIVVVSLVLAAQIQQEMTLAQQPSKNQQQQITLKKKRVIPPRIEKPLTQAEKVQRYNAEMARIQATHRQQAARAQAIAELRRRQSLISRGLIEQGFTQNEVRAALGTPESWSRHDFPEQGRVVIIWHYRDGLVELENGICTGWSTHSRNAGVGAFVE